METEGRVVYRHWRLFGCEFLSDLIAHDYMRRWILRTPLGMVRVHHILRSDQDRHFHDHPMDFTSVILSGGYVEHRPGRRPCRWEPGDIVTRRAEDLHRIELLGRSAWTLVFASPYRRVWGFQTEDGWVPASAYDLWKKWRDTKLRMRVVAVKTDA